jgi:hypothetical protein
MGLEVVTILVLEVRALEPITKDSEPGDGVHVRVLNGALVGVVLDKELVRAQ